MWNLYMCIYTWQCNVAYNLKCHLVSTVSEVLLTKRNQFPGLLVLYLTGRTCHYQYGGRRVFLLSMAVNGTSAHIFSASALSCRHHLGGSCALPWLFRANTRGSRRAMAAVLLLGSPCLFAAAAPTLGASRYRLRAPTQRPEALSP